MKENHLKVSLRTSPHIWRGVSIQRVMLDVVLALIPIVGFSIYCFGLSALALIFVTTFSAVFTEWCCCKFSKKQSTINDFSALITGLLLSLTLPPAFPLWLGSLGGIVAILLGKFVFGGLGFNLFNPALVGRAFLQAAFPVSITSWSEPFLSNRFHNFLPTSLTIPFTDIVPSFAQQINSAHDTIAGATPLASFKFSNIISDYTDLFLGLVSGSIGEVSAALILISGFYLIIRHVVDWRIPFSILATVAIFSACLGLITTKCPPPLFMLCSGGLMFGSIFMATDMVTSPVTSCGMLLYGMLIGILVVVIRVFGGLPEGMMYAILIGNAVTPLFNRITQPRVFGAKKFIDRIIRVVGGSNVK